jgi:hypothetical protein
MRYRGGSFGWLLLLFVMSPIGLMLTALQLTSLGDPLIETSQVVLVACFGIWIALATLCVLGMMTRWATQRAYPFSLGTYVFPTQIVLAEPNKFWIYSLLELSSVNMTHVSGPHTASHTRFDCVFADGTRLVMQKFPSDPGSVDDIATALSQGKRVIADALASRRVETLRPLDPFFEARAMNFTPTSEPGPEVRPTPRWTRFRSLLALGVALAVTGGVVLVRLGK